MGHNENSKGSFCLSIIISVFFFFFFKCIAGFKVLQNRCLNGKFRIIPDDGFLFWFLWNRGRFGMNGVLHLPACLLFTTAMDDLIGLGCRISWFHILILKTMQCSGRSQFKVWSFKSKTCLNLSKIYLVNWFLCFSDLGEVYPVAFSYHWSWFLYS